MIRSRLRSVVPFALLLVLTAGAVVADQGIRSPRPAHFQEFISYATNDTYAVALFSETARCDAAPAARTAHCSDPATRWTVRFDGGCREVSGEGACVRGPLFFSRALVEGGVWFQVACPGGTALAGDGILLMAPAGSTCRSPDGRSVECFVGTPAERGATLVTATCEDGCGPEQGAGVTCRACPAGNCG